jgi:hypothetical protein
MDWVGRNLCEFLYYQLLGTTRISSLEFGGGLRALKTNALGKHNGYRHFMSWFVGPCRAF